MNKEMTVEDLISDLSLFREESKIYIDAGNERLLAPLRVEIGYNATVKKSIIILHTLDLEETQKGGR